MSLFKPYAYQQECIAKLLTHNSYGLFIDMGLGKTVITLTAVNELIRYRFEVGRCLVIAPLSVAMSTWQTEISKWSHLGGLTVSTVVGSKTARIKALSAPADVYVINRENVPWLVDYLSSEACGWLFDMVVVDESTSFKNPKAKRFKALCKIRNKIRRLVLLTGTPTPNGLMDMWAQSYLLDGGRRLYNNFYRFREAYFIPGRAVNGVVYDYKIRAGAYEEITHRLSDISLSLKSEDYLELPAITYVDNLIELDTTACKAYAKFERGCVLRYLNDSESEGTIMANTAADLSGKLLQLAGGAIYQEDSKDYVTVHDTKIKALTELIEPLNENVIIFYNYIHEKARICNAFSDFKGEVRVFKSDKDIADWNEGEVNILIAHPSSMGYGLNLQKGGRRIIWFGLPQSYEQYAQANKRLHRQGQQDKVFIHHLVCKGTRDEDVLSALSRKDDMQKYLLSSLALRVKACKT